MHDGRPLVAPHRQCQGLADLLHQRSQALAREFDAVQPGQRSQAQLQGCRTQVVTRAAGVLRHQVQALETDQVAVGLGGAHAGSGRQVTQHQGPAGGGQHLQQAETNFHRLDAGPLRGRSGCVGG